MITRCGSEEFCNSFSFRFSNYNDQDNCLLSGLNTSNILPNSDLVPDSDWDIWQFRCKDSSSRDWVLRLEASKMSSLVVDATSAVSGLSSCARRCQDMAGCLVFAFSSQGYTNCQVTRLQYSHLGRTDILQDRQWDLFELRTTGGGGGGGGVTFPSSGGCYEKLKTGYRHYSGYYQDHLNVRDIEECKQECARSHNCKSLSYRSDADQSRMLPIVNHSRYATSSSRTDNCLLSNIETPVVNVGHFFI